MPKRSERKRLVTRLDNIFSLYIRARDKKCCTRTSRCSDVLQCGHLFTRASYSTRWNILYSFGQCSSCNMKHEYHPEIMIDWFIDKFGLDAFKQGIRDHSQNPKFTNKELQEKIDYYNTRTPK